MLTQVASVMGDDLMFTPEEIRAELPPEPPSAPPPAWRPPAQGGAAEAAPAPSVAAHNEAPVLPDLQPSPAAVAAPRPAATLNPAPPVLDFPELVLPGSKPAVTKPAPAAAPPAVSGPLMPDLALNFDFALPDEPAVSAQPAPKPIVAPAPAVAPAAIPAAAPVKASAPVANITAPPPAKPSAALAAAPVVASPPPPRVEIRPEAQRLVSEDFPELSLEVEAGDVAADDAALMALDPAEITAAVLVSLKPEIEKLVRSELAKQIAVLHVEALKRTLGALQPQLDKLVTGKIEEMLKRR